MVRTVRAKSSSPRRRVGKCGPAMGTQLKTPLKPLQMYCVSCRSCQSFELCKSRLVEMMRKDGTPMNKFRVVAQCPTPKGLIYHEMGRIVSKVDEAKFRKLYPTQCGRAVAESPRSLAPPSRRRAPRGRSPRASKKSM